MAAGLGYKEFSTGDVLTAADANGYLASQVVMVFADAAARTAAITSPQEGMISYLKDTNATQYYSGSAWANVGASSASGLTLITKQTFSAATSINVNNCFSATYENYKVILTTTSVSGSAPTTIRLRVGGADNSTSNYGSGYAESNSGGVSNRYSNAADGWIKGNFNMTNNFIFTFDITQPFLSQRTAFAGVYGQEDSGNRVGAPAGYFNATTSFDGFSIILASNNVTGFVSVYGYQI
jgi:hypothetical protein